MEKEKRKNEKTPRIARRLDKFIFSKKEKMKKMLRKGWL